MGFNFTYSGAYRTIGNLNGNFDTEFTSSGWLEVTEGRMQIDAYLVGAGNNGTGSWNDYRKPFSFLNGGSGGNGGGRLTAWGIILEKGDRKWIEVGKSNKSRTAMDAKGGRSQAFGYDSINGSVSEGGVGGREGTAGSSGENGGYAYWDSLQDTRAGTRPGYRFAAGGGGCGKCNWNNSTNRGTPANGGSGGADGGGSGGNGFVFGIKAGSNATFYGSGGGGEGYGEGNGYCGCGYDGIVMMRNARISGSTYKISVNADVGSNYVVERTYSRWGQTGVMENGWVTYAGDKLKITASPKTNYKIIGLSVNGNSFESGRTYEVNGNVNIKVVSQPLASEISASDACTGELCNINIVRYSSAYTHVVKYEFLSTSGYICETDPPSMNFNWRIPAYFADLMPNVSSQPCKIMCETYESGVLLGTSSCTITVSVSSGNSPSIVCKVQDIDPVTSYLTGDNSKLVIGKSDIRCSLTATAKSGAKIKQLCIGSSVTDIPNQEQASKELKVSDYTGRNIAMYAVDTRGYKSLETVRPSAIINYKMLTCYADLNRESPTSGRIGLKVHGDYFNGSFGARHNNIMLDFQYRENTTSAMFSAWYTIPTEYIAKGSESYQNSTTMPVISLNDIVGTGTEFDYKKSYVFKIRARDGAVGHILSESIASEGNAGSITVSRGIPVFDWGENDFNFNVPVSINGISIFDIIYPVGSIYIATNDVSPAVFVPDSVWEKIEDKFILGSSPNYALGSEGGEKEHTLNVEEMPSHAHTKGTMNITGVGHGAYGEFKSQGPEGAFYGAGGKAKNTSDAWYDSNGTLGFDASRSWTGETSYVGSSQPHNNMPPYIALNIWKRVS